MFGISANELFVLLAVAAVVLGPERLPHYTQQLTRLIRELRKMAQGATDQVRAELGPEFDDVDWRKLDPRQYDPRRIVRDALADTFDPDDPLGLKDTSTTGRGHPTANGGSTRQANGSLGDGPAGATGSPAGSGGAEGRPAAAGSTGPAFDPDAT